MTLEPGSRVIADAPALDFAVLEITGDVKQVLARYAEQLAAPADHVSKVTITRTSDGGTYFSLSYSPDGGGGASFVSDASHRYLKVNWSSD